VLGALARALRLSAPETAHLFDLAGVERPGAGHVVDTVRPSVLRLLDRMADLPAMLVDALARTLLLTPAEHEYVLRLAGHGGRPPGEDADAMTVHVQRLLDALGTSPAYAITASWAIVGWNRAYERFYPGVARVPASERNLLWLVFTDPAVRELLGDWTTDSRRFLTQFRAEVGPRLADRDVVDLVDRLRAASPHFREGWASHDVDRFSSGERRFEHPVVGTLLLEHHQLTPADAPGLHLVVYTAAGGSDTAARLARLAS